MTWRTAFGDDYQVPDVIRCAEGIEDLSDQGCIAPAFGKIIDGIQVLVWSDHPEPDRRDHPECPRFLVSVVVPQRHPWWPHLDWPAALPDETGCVRPQDPGIDTDDPEAAMRLFMLSLVTIQAIHATQGAS